MLWWWGWWWGIQRLGFQWRSEVVGNGNSTNEWVGEALEAWFVGPYESLIAIAKWLFLSRKAKIVEPSYNSAASVFFPLEAPCILLNRNLPMGSPLPLLAVFSVAFISNYDFCFLDGLSMFGYKFFSGDFFEDEKSPLINNIFYITNNHSHEWCLIMYHRNWLALNKMYFFFPL